MSDDLVSTRWISDCSSILLEGRYRCAEVFKDISPERFLAIEDLYRRADALNRAVADTLNSVFAKAWGNEGACYFWPGYVVSHGARLDEVGSSASADRVVSLEQWRDPVHPAAYGTDLVTGMRFHLTPLSIWMDLFYGQVFDHIRIRGFTQYVSAIRERKSGPVIDVQGRPVHCLALSPLTSGAQYSSGILHCGLADVRSPAELASTLQSHLAASFGPQHRFPPVQTETGNLVPSDVADAIEPVFHELLWSIFYGYRDSDHLRLKSLEAKLRNWGATESAERLVKAAGFLAALSESEKPLAFNYYYVFPLESTLGPSARLTGEGATALTLDLGTINIYSTSPIPAALIHLLKPWLQAMYAQLRLLETFDQAVTRAVQLERTSQAHELKELVGALPKRDRTVNELKGIAAAFSMLLGSVPDGFVPPTSLRALVDDAIAIVSKVNTAIDDGRMVAPGLDPSLRPLPLMTGNVRGWYMYVLALVGAIRNALKNSTGEVSISFDGDILIRNPGNPPSGSPSDKLHIGSSKEAILYFLTQAQAAFGLQVAPMYTVDYVKADREWHSRLRMPLLAGADKE